MRVEMYNVCRASIGFGMIDGLVTLVVQLASIHIPYPLLHIIYLFVQDHVHYYYVSL